MRRVVTVGVFATGALVIGLATRTEPPVTALQPFVAPIEASPTSASPSITDPSLRGAEAVVPPLAENGYPQPIIGTPLELLAMLRVDDAPAAAPYDRKRFGPGWLDLDHNGCNGRQDALLAADSFARTVPGPRCTIEAITMTSAYDDLTIEATSADQIARAIQIDHIVPVHDAYRRLCCVTGPNAQLLRELFYNDPANLLAVSGASNQRKGDHLIGDPELNFLSDKARCLIAQHTVQVKAVYDLALGSREASALAELLARCPA